MEKYFLSNEAVKTLKEFALHSPIDDSKVDIGSPAIQQLLEYEFINCLEIGYGHCGEHMLANKFEYSITELGRGYLEDYQRNIASFESVKAIAESAKQQAKSAESLSKSTESLAKSAKSQAESAESLSKSAKKIAKKSDIKSWIALLFSGIAIFFEFAVNHEKIMEYINQILQSIG